MNVLLEAYLKDLAINVINGLFTKGYNWLKGDRKPYQIELAKVINLSIDQYHSEFPVPENDQTYFVDSSFFLEELIKYQFDLSLNADILKNAIAADNRIIAPSDGEINRFLVIFNEQILLSPLLKALHIEHNNKETTFRLALKLEVIDEKLDNFIAEAKNTVHQLQIDQVLIDEWSRELETIKQLLYSYRSYTAFELINKLQARISEKNISDVQLECQLLYLKGSALDDQNDFAVKKDAAQLYIRAYKSRPNNIEYARHAALGYLAINEYDKARTVVAGLLAKDEYDLTAWSILLRLADDPSEFLNQVPKVVQERREFKINAFIVFSQDIEQMRWVHLPDSPLLIEHQPDEPGRITYTDFRFWLLFTEYLFARIYYMYPMITNYAESEELKNSELFQYYFKLIGKLLDATKGSELTRNLSPLRFKYHYARLILTGEQSEVHLLGQSYDELDHKNHSHVLQLVQAYNLLDQDIYRERSVQAINNYLSGEQHELLILFRTSLLFNLGRNNEAIEGYENYILGLDYLSTILMNNLLQFIRMAYRERPSQAMDFLNKLLAKDHFPSEGMKLLLKWYTLSIHSKETLDMSESDAMLDQIETDHDPKYPENKDFYLTTLTVLRKNERIITFLRPRISFSGDIRDLVVFCEALFHSEGNKIELLQVLRKARQAYPPHRTLLKAECELRRKQRDWTKMIELAEIGIRAFPDEPEFVKSLFFAALNDLAVEKIVAYADHGIAAPLNEQGQLILYQAFLQAGLFDKASDVIYKAAMVRSHIQSRQTFLSAIIRLPEGTFQHYDKVVPECCVSYLFNGELHHVNIGVGPAFLPEESVFLGRHLNEEFSYFDAFIRRYNQIQIVGITNKFGALFDEIKRQAANPLSGLMLREFKMEGDTPDAVRTSLQKELGAVGTQQKDFYDDRLQRYDSGTLTFSELVKGAFRENPLDGYYTLTGEKNCFFQTIPTSTGSTLIKEATSFILDISTVMLFFELWRDKGLRFPHKFLISAYVPRKVKRMLTETSSEPALNMTMTITHDTVVPHFYADNFKEKRIEWLSALLTWINSNCEPDMVEEKLDLLPMEEEEHDDEYMDYLFDSRMIAERPGHLLITSDLFYIKTMTNAHQILTGPENYLKCFFPDTDLIPYLLSKNYVGLTLTREHLSDAFIEFVSGRSDTYTCAMENLRMFRSDSNFRNVAEGIKLLKWIYLQPTLSDEMRYRNAHYIMMKLVEGLTDRGLNFFAGLLDKAFALLPKAHGEIRNIFSRVTNEQ